MFKGKRVIIFDMDGTLIDSVGIWNEVDRRLIEKLQPKKAAHLHPSEQEIQKMRDDVLRQYRDVQDPYRQYCRILKERYGFHESPEEIIRTRYDIAQDLLKNVVDYKDGAPAFIKALKDVGMILAIASTTKRDNMAVYRTENRNIMEKAPIEEFFSLVYTREDVKEIKPSPEVYRKVMETLGVKPEECLVFEDSLVGVEAAKNAEVQVVAIYDRYSDGERKEIEALADYRIDDYQMALAMLG